MVDPGIELRHLRYFVAVAEELHFGRAAARLHLAQPPLSQQIRKLEEILGHALFIRTSRAVRLTAAGEVLLERSRRTLQSVGEDLEEARSVGRGEVGFLKVGLIGSSVLSSIPALIGKYRQRHPKVNLQLRESYTAGIIEGLLKGTLDVGFMRDGGVSEDIDVHVLFSEPYLAVLPAGHRLAHRRAISPADLRHEPFVFFPAAAGRRAYEKSISVCEAYGYRPRIVQEAPHLLTIARLVGAGLGVTIMPACVRQIASDDVVCRPLLGTTVKSDIELAFRAGEDRPIVRAFRELVASSSGPRRAR